MCSSTGVMIETHSMKPFRCIDAPAPALKAYTEKIQCSAASRALDCGNPANLVALAQIRVDRAQDGTRSSRSWRRLRDLMHPSIN